MLDSLYYVILEFYASLYYCNWRQERWSQQWWDYYWLEQIFILFSVGIL